jgi:hypothetical protein
MYIVHVLHGFLGKTTGENASTSYKTVMGRRPLRASPTTPPPRMYLFGFCQHAIPTGEYNLQKFFNLWAGINVSCRGQRIN